MPGAASGPRVLVVDDDATSALVTAEYVRRAEPRAEVVWCSGAGLAMEALDARPDLVLTDMVLGPGGGSGLDVIRAARRLGLRVVAMSCIATYAPAGVPFVDKCDMGAYVRRLFAPVQAEAAA